MDVRVHAWKTAKEMFEVVGGFLFRGQADSSWDLQPGLERAVQRWGLRRGCLRNAEAVILEEFKRRAHQYVTMPPKPEEDLEWLALIQHHGGPTRLLDFTHSPYIAAFFAMEAADGEAAIWAVNREWIHAHAPRTFGLPEASGRNLRLQVINLCHELIQGKRNEPGLLYVEPVRLNDRMALQQGVFLFPCNISASFGDNLFSQDKSSADEFRTAPVEEVFEITQEERCRLLKAAIVRLRLPREIHASAVVDLASMNVTAATLFSGLDGFARSFSVEVRRIAAAEEARIPATKQTSLK
jgi:hypothetical protein